MKVMFYILAGSADCGLDEREFDSPSVSLLIWKNDYADSLTFLVFLFHITLDIYTTLCKREKRFFLMDMPSISLISCLFTKLSLRMGFFE